ncbi:MAG TPA: YedE family putative selenium transporter [Bacillota bacterium]|nr:YedE family putative selenium transporter [Peptococcaceae bacterium MAG4]NLW38465.1 YedE-related selenium metabolism membrane protein [Peptococcaceae bacterium]HPZ43122.1 YedE family putative selenium transporter [Bacillota bacterium]HQD75236.1 YedE family putative selenium transporter [Bacillota bacterium]HUM58050.1 YedE family putative selenium transporter [Bacillota bacterium]
MNQRNLIILAGSVFGLLAILLVKYGNPPNMGFCIACFLRDITGGLGLQRAPVVQYIRPEILGLVLGAFAAALVSREFRTLGGSSALTRFVLGFVAMIGMLVFLGCPLRAILRLAGGDLNALVGIAGLVAGVALGIPFLRKGFSLGRALPQNKANGYVFVGIIVFFLILLLAKPAFIYFSTEGPASMRAPLALSLGVGLLAGVLAQRTRLCLAGGVRDFILFRDFYLLYGFIAILVVALIGNLVLGNFKLGFAGQPIAHSDGLWNFLGMMLAGLCFVLMGGCPLRQLVSAAEGNTDSAVTVLGLMAGAAFAHNFGLAASAGGVPAAGQAAVLIGFAVIVTLAFFICRANLIAREVSAGGRNKGRAGATLS